MQFRGNECETEEKELGVKSDGAAVFPELVIHLIYKSILVLCQCVDLV
jgi:hypothetical protein